MKKAICTLFIVLAAVFINPTAVQANTNQIQIDILKQMIVLLQQQLAALLQSQGFDSVTDYTSDKSQDGKYLYDMDFDINEDNDEKSAFITLSLKADDANLKFNKWKAYINCEGDLNVTSKTDENLCGETFTFNKDSYYSVTDSDLKLLTLSVENEDPTEFAKLTIETDGYDANGTNKYSKDFWFKFSLFESTGDPEITYFEASNEINDQDSSTKEYTFIEWESKNTNHCKLDGEEVDTDGFIEKRITKTTTFELECYKKESSNLSSDVVSETTKAYYNTD